MTTERIAELREVLTSLPCARYDTGEHLRECLDEIERLTKIEAAAKELVTADLKHALKEFKAMQDALKGAKE